MPRPRRMFLPNQALFITCKTFQGRFLLKPTKEANRRILGILARCTNIYPGVRLHAYVFLSNHYHLIISASEPRNIPKFMCLLNTELAKKVGGKIHGWADKVFRRRYDATPILDEASLAERLSYIFMHGAKEGLVESPRAWPGIHCIETLVDEKEIVGYWQNDSLACTRRASGVLDPALSDCEIPYTLKVSPLPTASPQDFVAQCYTAALVSLKEIRGEKRALGRRKILEERADGQPRSPGTKTPRPWCHTICPKLRLEWLVQYRRFCGAMMEATCKLGAIYRRDFVIEQGVGFLPAQI